jgi:arsenate reductase (thioredoxin)
MQVFRNIR